MLSAMINDSSNHVYLLCMIRKPQIQFQLHELFLRKACWTQSVLCPAVRWKGQSWNKIPNDSQQTNCPMVSLHVNALIFPSCQGYSAAPNPFQSTPISFQPRECCRSPSSHLSVSGSVSSKHSDMGRRGQEVVGGNEREHKQVTDNSVFGSYRREGLADLSEVKASWGWLRSGRTPWER